MRSAMLSSIIVVTGLKLMKTLQDTIRRGALGRRDLTEAFIFLLNHPEISGPVNVCLPKPLRNKDLARTLGRALHRPSFMPAPGFMVKLIFGGIRLRDTSGSEGLAPPADQERFRL